MAGKVSAVINTLNEEENIERAIKSLSWADEIIVCDMHSEDKTVELARKHGAKVVFFQKAGYVEPARNFAISQATYDWVFLLDADEEVSLSLSEKLKEIVSKDDCDFVQIPRKNTIFGKWMKASMWWPDYHIRLFKKGKVKWGEKIHSKPQTKGTEKFLPSEEGVVIYHHHYMSVFQFIERMNRYTSIQAKDLKEEGYKFQWMDLIRKPLGEFLSRFFANRGYEDGVHGLALSFLQAFSFLVLYLKVWETEGFTSKQLNLNDLRKVSTQAGREVNYWFRFALLSKNPLVKFAQKVKSKIT